MSDKRCLYCYQPLEGTGDFHQKCSRSFFGQPEPPSLDLDKKHLLELAEQTVARSVTMTGVQPKLSVTIEPASGDAKRSRLTIVGLWGQYILKPPNPEFAGMPENEDLTMRLNELVGIPTADHSLIRLSSGELAYITHRFDRHKGNKLAVEDMCQLTETLTVDKYRGSMEKIGRIITDFSSRPGYDKLIFLRRRCWHG